MKNPVKRTLRGLCEEIPASQYLESSFQFKLNPGKPRKPGGVS